MTKAGNDLQDSPVKEKDSSELASAVDQEEIDELDEFAESEELEYKPGENPTLDSVEIDVDEILSEIAAETNTGDTASIRVRKRLEEMMERKRRHEDTIDFDEYDLDS